MLKHFSYGQKECWLLELLMKIHIIKENYKGVITNISVR